MTVINAQNTTVTINGQTIGQIQSFSAFDGSAAENDISNLASTAREYRPGLQDFGSFTMEVQRDSDDAGQAEAKSMLAAQTIATMVVSYPDEGTLNVSTFSVFVKSISTTGETGGILTGTIDCRITGAVVESDSTP